MNTNLFLLLFFTAFPLGIRFRSRSPAQGVAVARREKVPFRPPRSAHQNVPTGSLPADPRSTFETLQNATAVAQKGRKRPPRVRRRAESNIKHLELLVVVGPDVQQVHKDDTERYILTILNIAAELLRDSSLGVQFRVHLVGLIVLEEPEESIRISSNITSSLISVCEWGAKVNPEGDADPHHADLVLYVTRYDLELPDGNKQVHGATQLGGACSAFWSCIIAEDTGFGLGVTVAHEIGHSFGIQHDGEGNRCPSSGFIMGSAGGHNSVDVTWSACSRDQLFDFFRTGQGACVDDLPASEEAIPGRKPGLYYGLDEQCKVAFGDGATACTFTRRDTDMCKVLSCHANPADRSSCTRRFDPLLDGTECGLNQWCSKGRCSSSEDLDPIHGHWGSWAAFTPCSRSCGGGITARRRQCNNPRPAFGGRPCEGKDVEAEMCNMEPCLTTQKDFIDEQCGETNSVPLQIHFSTEYLSFYKWISATGYVKGDPMCKHMCKASGKDFMMTRGEQFRDGTRCELESPEDGGEVGLCLLGRCRRFGCDGRLDSGSRRDACQVCGGDNRTCVRVTGSYAEGEAREYVTFLALPPNATAVRVVNRKPLFTHLAVKVGGRYVVAGKGRISYNATYPSALEDGRIEYEVFLTEDSLPSREEVRVEGPVQEDVEIQVYRKYGREFGAITNPDVTFSYFQPVEEQVYVWVSRPGPCSVSCGEGVLQVGHFCLHQATGETTDAGRCLGTPKPATQPEPCAMPPCPPRWAAGDFGPCSATCGGGVMERAVRCAREGPPGPASILPDSECTGAPRPPAVAPCNPGSCPPRWKESEPGRCSATCGVGVASRNVTCIQDHHGLETVAEESLCPAEEKPPDVAPCVVNVCPLGWDSKGAPSTESADPLWPRSGENQTFHVWSPIAGKCSVTCGGGRMLVSYVCLVFDTREHVLDERCNHTRKPPSQGEICNPTLCPPSWEVKELAPCPVTCGGGKIPLLVRCIRPHANSTKALPHSKCGRMHKPASTKECATVPCPPRWFMKKGACSASCGGGILRKVPYCTRPRGEPEGEEVLPDAHCEGLPRPGEQEPCNLEPCPPRWKATRMGPCSSSCGFGVASQSFSCMQRVGGREVELPEDRCPEEEKPPQAGVPCVVRACPYEWGFTPWTECSVSCGTGVQTRQDFCLSPQTEARVNPLFCRHTPKPVTVRTCSLAPCPAPTSAGPPLGDLPTSPTTQGREAGPFGTTGPTRAWYRALGFPDDSLKPAPERRWEHTPEEHGVCGRLYQGSSGVIDMTGTATADCTVAIGRPLGESIALQVLESSLDCSAGEMLLLSTRRMWRTACKKLSLLAVNTTKANTLTVRQRLRGPRSGGGVVLRYSSRAAPEKDHQDCDVQLFGPRGEIVSPPPLSSGEHPGACRTFIDVAPQFRIAVRAADEGANGNRSGYILIRDVRAMKTTVVQGNQPFSWESTGSRAEIEFHADFGPDGFRAEYWAIEPQ